MNFDRMNKEDSYSVLEGSQEELSSMESGGPRRKQHHHNSSSSVSKLRRSSVAFAHPKSMRNASWDCPLPKTRPSKLSMVASTKFLGDNNMMIITTITANSSSTCTSKQQQQEQQQQQVSSATSGIRNEKTTMDEIQRNLTSDADIEQWLLMLRSTTSVLSDVDMNDHPKRCHPRECSSSTLKADLENKPSSAFLGDVAANTSDSTSTVKAIRIAHHTKKKYKES